MANSITIGAVGVKLISFTEHSREYRGEVAVAFDNTLMDGRDKPRRSWEGRTDWLLPAAEESLRGQIEGGPVTCTGLVLYGEEVNCVVTVDSAERGPDVSGGTPNWNAVNSQLTLSFREVGIAPAHSAIAGAYLNVGGTYVPVITASI